jgi:hypothetical protein
MFENQPRRTPFPAILLSTHHLFDPHTEALPLRNDPRHTEKPDVSEKLIDGSHHDPSSDNEDSSPCVDKDFGSMFSITFLNGLHANILKVSPARRTAARLIPPVLSCKPSRPARYPRPTQVAAAVAVSGNMWRQSRNMERNSCDSVRRAFKLP